jgi:DMSO/TMAO reductase YedYZ molybdopterin-dependent catalytic subunit
LRELADLPVFSAGPKTTTRQLSLEGHFQSPKVLTLQELRRLPKVGLTEDFRCLEGWVVRGVVWEGIRVADVLHLSGLLKDARWILFGSGEFTTVVDVKTASRGNTILAMRKSGKQLTKAHGGPLRLVFESHQCYESVKSVDRIVALSKFTEGTAHGIATSRIGT